MFSEQAGVGVGHRLGSAGARVRHGPPTWLSAARETHLFSLHLISHTQLKVPLGTLPCVTSALKAWSLGAYFSSFIPVVFGFFPW